MLPRERPKTTSFLLGAYHGGLWSLLLVAAVTPTLVSELSLSRRSAVDPVLGIPTPLSTYETALFWVEGIIAAFLMITVPWALTAGLVRMSKDSARTSEKSHSE